jgi:TonB family protein
MIESAARVERFDLPASATPSFLWEVPGKPVAVRIPFPLIDRLEHEAIESFRSLTSRGSEIGGVLIGGVTAGSPLVVTIEDFELIPCDYARGPLYRLSDADMDRFDRVFAQRVAAGFAVTGFFRSHTRKGLMLDPEDVTLLESRFSAPHHIALLIRPFASKPSSAGFFIREDGAVKTESSYREFPFRSSLLTAAGPAPQPTEIETPATGLGTALPPPSVPKSVVRGQIVPIASRREVSSAVPPLATEMPPRAAPPAEVSAPTAPATPTTPAAPTPTASAAVEAPPAPAVSAAPPVVAEPEAAPAVEPARAELETNTAFEAAPPGEPAEAVLDVPRKHSKKVMWIAISAIVPVLLLLILFVYPGLLNRGSKPTPGSPQDSSPLALRVQRTGGELFLSWNRDSDAIRNAASAVLSISDGPQQENYSMDVAQLRSSSFVYTPATGDVTFKMEVTSKDGSKTASEGVRVLQQRPSPMPPTDQQADASKTAPAATAPPTVVPAPAETTAATETPAEEAPTRFAARPIKPFRADSLSSRLRPATTADIPDAPSAGTVAAGGAAMSSLKLGAAAPPPMAPPPAPAAPETRTPAPATKTGGRIQEAKQIYKVDPEYPKIARDAGARGVVELIATIGVDGTVKKVTIVKGHPLLARPASDAVMKWRYTPTMLNGVAVEGQVQVAVNFVGR